MNWVKENKFLTGFLIVLLIGVGSLGYEVYTAGSASDDAQGQYTEKATEYFRLRHLVPFPNAQVLEAYEAQKKEAAEVIDAFQANLAKQEFPLEPLTPERFQDKLKASVTGVRAKAADANVKLPDKGFFLGFERYETTPPTPEAAAPLGRQLQAIEWVVNQYIANSVKEIHSLDRAELPEEGGGGERRAGSGGPRPGGGAGAGPGGGNRARAGAGRSDLVKYYPFNLVVICQQPKLSKVLDAITGTQAPQFYVLRRIRIINQNEKGPPKGIDPTKPVDKVDYIVGEELIEASAEWDIVDFVPPAERDAAKDAAPAK